MSTRWSRSSALALGMFLMALTSMGAPAPATPPRGPYTAPWISVDEVKVGQRGYGITVFQGTKPERFEVEIVGVMRNLAPGLSYVLVKLTGHDLERSGISAGMSGSPVYFDDRLLGAVSFGWPFSNDAVGGVTPIEAMRKLGEDPGKSALAIGTPVVPLSDLVARRIPSDLLARELSALSALSHPEGAGAPGAVVWTASGFGERSLAALRLGFGPVPIALAGRAESAPTQGQGGPSLGVDDLRPGGAVSGVILDGDFRLGVTGTVTDRGGDSLLAFGHNFLGIGKVSIPMAPAEVVTVLSNQYNSFKIANVGPVVGAVVEDRRTGIEGRIGATAPTFPVVVKLHGEREHEYHMRIADVPELVAGMVGTAALASLEAASRTAGGQSLDLAARFRLAGRGDLSIAQSFDGDNAANEAISYLLSIASYLAQNDLERLRIEGVEIEFDQVSAPRSLSIEGAHAERTVVRPGETIRVAVDLRAFRGEKSRRTLDLAVPTDLSAGRYSVWVGDGASVDAARLQLEPANPENVTQALELLGSFHSRRELAAIVAAPGPGIVAGGRAMPQLPGSVRSLWGAGGPGLGQPISNVVVARASQPLPAPASGIVRLDFEVRRENGMPGESPDGTAPDGGEGIAALAPSTVSSPSSPRGVPTASFDLSLENPR